MAFSPEIDIRRSILDETRTLLIRKGISNLSIRQIAREVGCSIGTIYFYFDNKDRLIHSLIEEGFEMLVDRLEAAIASGKDAAMRMKLLCRSYIDFAITNPEYYEVMFALKPERMARYPAEKYRKARRSVELIAEVVGDISGPNTGTSAYASAHLVWAFLHGIITLIQAQRIDKRLEQEVLVQSAIDRALIISQS